MVEIISLSEEQERLLELGNSEDESNYEVAKLLLPNQPEEFALYFDEHVKEKHSKFLMLCRMPVPDRTKELTLELYSVDDIYIRKSIVERMEFKRTGEYYFNCNDFDTVVVDNDLQTYFQRDLILNKDSERKLLPLIGYPYNFNHENHFYLYLPFLLEPRKWARKKYLNMIQKYFSDVERLEDSFKLSVCSDAPFVEIKFITSQFLQKIDERLDPLQAEARKDYMDYLETYFPKICTSSDI